jgi:N6-adenosine-specific RNA methylase IME4
MPREEFMSNTLPTLIAQQQPSQELYERLCRTLAEALDEARSVSETKNIHDQAAGILEWARRAKNYQVEADAVELRVKAQRVLGKMIEVQKQTVGLNEGGRPKTGLSDNPVLPKPTLASQGIDKNLAHAARTLAALSEEQFEQRVDEARASAGRVVRRVVNAVKIEQERETYRARTYEGGKVEDLEALAAGGFRAGVIYVDFAWKFEAYSSKTGKQRSPERHYDAMSPDEIMAMAPIISALAAPDCALLLWGTWPHLLHLGDFIRACEGFKFEYKSAAFVWVKLNPNGEGLFVEDDDLFSGMGYGTRSNTEYVLRATRGSPMRLNADVHQVIMAPVRAHSEKPEEVARRIERLYPGPYLELFARLDERPNWVLWGNEVAPPAEASREQSSPSFEAAE